MAQEKLSEDLLALLRIVNDAGASVCVGTCEHSSCDMFPERFPGLWYVMPFPHPCPFMPGEVEI